MNIGTTQEYGRPFGVGLLLGVAVPTEGVDPAEENRIAVALAAYRAGYFLIATLELVLGASTGDGAADVSLS